LEESKVGDNAQRGQDRERGREGDKETANHQ